MNIAKQKLDRFVRRFDESYRLLAYHAALPLLLTPELLNYLQNQFLRGQVPWVAEVDLLLSDLCSQVGYELYAMDTAVRAYLLAEMPEALGTERMKEVARLLISYVRYLAKNNPNFREHELQAQQWSAMVYLDEQRENAVREIAQAFERNKTSQTEIARLARITQELAPQLNAYPELINYAQLVSQVLDNPESIQPEIVNQPHQVLNIPLPTPPTPHSPLPTPPLQFFEFTTVTVNETGQEVSREHRQAQFFTEDLGNGISLEMVAIPGGTFLMGSPETEAERSEREGPQHSVTVKPFFLGKYPVTQAQWQVVAALPEVSRSLDPDPSNFKGADLPVEQVSWHEAVEFCARLSRLTKRDYRLPSEAEWEYACRAGTTTPFHFGETITTELANYHGDYTYGSGPKGIYRKQTTPVGSFQVANNFGLYDMHGNVYEWCSDIWHDSYEGAPTDDRAWLSENDNDNHSKRLLRVGSWVGDPGDCRSAYRNGVSPVVRSFNLGFRVACSSVWT